MRNDIRAGLAGLFAVILGLVPAQAYASHVFPAWKAAIMQATSGSALTGTVECVLIDEGTDTPTTSDDFLDDVLSGARIGTPQTLASKTYTSPSAGVFDAADITFPSVTGASAEGILCYVQTAGADSTDPLVVYLNGVSVTPNGGNISVVFDSGSNRIFSL